MSTTIAEAARVLAFARGTSIAGQVDILSHLEDGEAVAAKVLQRRDAFCTEVETLFEQPAAKKASATKAAKD